MSVGRKDHKERKENRIQHYRDNADKANQTANDTSKKAKEMGSVIPFGQPILIGHHSEKSHRSLLKRIDSTYKKAHEQYEKADYYNNKADSAECNSSISGDDPEAIKRYQEKLKSLEANQNFMKAVNRAWKQGNEALKALGVTDKLIAELKSSMQSYQHQPFPPYSLSNNNAEIRRVKNKILALQKLDKMEEQTITFKGGLLKINLEINRVQYFFDKIPPEEIRIILKKNGFKWSPSQKAWQRQRTMQAIIKAKKLIPEIEIE